MSKTQIYLGTALLDFTGLINVKRQVKDYRDPDIGASNKSYTLEIPLTPTNRVLLKYVDDLRSRQEVTDTARIVVDGIEVISGKLRIMTFTSLEVRAIIEADDWVDDISDTSIRDLDWSSSTHTFSATNITNSWTAAAGALYRYPLINFGNLISEDYGSGGSKIYPYDLYPAWSVADIVTKIFSGAGYTLAGSGFFAGTLGQSLIVLSDPTPASDDFISGKNCDVYINDAADNQDSTTVAAGDNGILSLTQAVVIDGETEDEGNDFSTSTHRYTVPETGTYRFQGQVDIYCTFNRELSRWTPTSNSLVFAIRKNGSTYLTSVSSSSVTAFDTANRVYALDSGYVYLEAGDYIELYVSLAATGTNGYISSLTASIQVMAGAAVSFLKNVWSEHNLWPGIGQTISPETFLPDLDGINFLKGLKEAFNLRFWMDRNNRTIYIETSDDFYGSTVIDLTDKIDYSEEIEMETLVSSYTKTQRFRWKPDTGDKAYTSHVATSGVPYEKELSMDSEYAKAGVTENENSVFSPTVLGDMPQVGHWSMAKVPRIYGSADYIGGGRQFPAYRSKTWLPRIFEWKGMVAFTNGNFNWHTSIDDSTGTNYTTFPSAECPDMSDLFDDLLLKDWNRIEKNKLVTCVLRMGSGEIIQFSTVVGTPSEEGFRATYKLNIEGIEMYFILNKITTDGDRVKCEYVQKL